MNHSLSILVAGLALALGGCSGPTAPGPTAGAPMAGPASVPPADATAGEAADHVEVGEASWYGQSFAGKPTASGEPFDPEALTAAHPDLPLGTEATVTNLANGRSVEVEINDRGPYADNREIDLSRAAAERLDMIEEGEAEVRIEAEPAAEPTAAD
jgi:rare lipoprotein A (peptidoglycan hydrolase)